MESKIASSSTKDAIRTERAEAKSPLRQRFPPTVGDAIRTERAEAKEQRR